MSELVAELAADLHRQHVQRMPFRPLVLGSDAVNTAYGIQRTLLDISYPQGVAIAGYKVGLTSSRMQALCGIDSPLAGVVVAGGVHASNTALSLSDYGHLGLEFEIGLQLKCDLPTSRAPLTIRDIESAVDGVCAAVEVIDDRHADYATLDAGSIIADNGWNAGAILGPFTKPAQDLSEAIGILRSRDSEIDRGLGRDVLGHPYASLAWLARHLAASGDGLKAGQIVLTGSLVPTRFPRAGDCFGFELIDIGSVAVTVRPVTNI